MQEKCSNIQTKLDRIFVHKFWAFPIFALFLWLLFQITFGLGEYGLIFISFCFEKLAGLATVVIPEGWGRSLVVDGIIAGVGGVMEFLPNILILFIGISVMEETGYMARASFITDNLMRKIGLNGKCFTPTIMGMGCSVPAILAARAIENRSDRIKTMLLIPLISCSAKLPFFILFAGAFFPNHAANVVFLFTVVLSFLSFGMMAFLFKKTLFKNAKNTPYFMQLPPYKIPKIGAVLKETWHNVEHYLIKIGTIVLLFSVVLWYMGNYPQTNDETIIENTYIGKFGQVLEPLVKPFGNDWKSAVAIATGFAGKEVVVSSMGVLFAVSGDANEESEGLRSELRNHFTPLAALALMWFVLIYTPCAAAFITLIRELNNWKWSLFSLFYQLAFAWIGAVAIYQIGKLLGFE